MKQKKIKKATFFALLFALVMMCMVCIMPFKDVQVSAAVVEFVGYSAGMTESELHEKTRLPEASEDAPAITIVVHVNEVPSVLIVKDL